MSQKSSPKPYSKVTHDIRVSVQPIYLEEHSEPADDMYVWAYTVQVENLSKTEVQLLSRHWKILDANGTSQEVIGDGVVGEQPTLKPGEGFRYTSGTSLHTPSGVMLGQYHMRSQNGEMFPIDIPAFSLDSPYHAPRLN